MFVELVLKAKKGDEESFNTLIDQEKDSIYRLAYSYTKSPDDALDVVQEAVYKAYISLGKLKNPQYFKTWLYRITINCAIDFLRKSKKIIYMERDKLEHIGDYIEHGEDRDDILDLRKALNDLDLKYKIVVILRFFEDLSLKEISEVLNLPLNTVKTRLYRGLDKLKIDLEEVEPLEK